MDLIAADRTAFWAAWFRENSAVTCPHCITAIRSLNVNSSVISEVISKIAIPWAVHWFISLIDFFFGDDVNTACGFSIPPNWVLASQLVENGSTVLHVRLPLNCPLKRLPARFILKRPAIIVRPLKARRGVRIETDLRHGMHLQKGCRVH